MAIPEPAKLVFLSDLDGLATEQKVRFLGCVKHHDTRQNHLYLSHHYPRLSYQIVACVNLDHVLEAMSSADFQPGAWLNVTGYTCGRLRDPINHVHLDGPPVYSEVTIRAVMLWNTESLDLAMYESALDARHCALSLEAEKKKLNAP